MVGMAAISCVNHFRKGIIRAEPARQIAASQPYKPDAGGRAFRGAARQRVKLLALAQMANLVGL
jgi:hypothetical protein